MNYFKREKINYYHLSSRKNKVDILKQMVNPESEPKKVEKEVLLRLELIASEIKKARDNNKPVICAFGAHTIKNGLGALLSILINEGWITHLATNGAGVIHDWEFSYQGASSEDVALNVAEGKFGIWEETGLYINLALIDGAYRGFGYGESIGAMIQNNGIQIPSDKELMNTIQDTHNETPLWKRAAALDYLDIIQQEHFDGGFMEIKHQYPEHSIQSNAFHLGIPFTSHPMFGHDIIYTHRACKGAAIGRCAERDFLSFVESVSHLEGGVYLSVGSAVMSPMIFEKSLSMARNVLRSHHQNIKNCSIHVVDLQKESWDWTKGEPPMNNPAYYLRFMKSFNRMGCPVDYTSIDNRDFFLYLYRFLSRH